MASTLVMVSVGVRAESKIRNLLTYGFFGGGWGTEGFCSLVVG